MADAATAARGPGRPALSAYPDLDLVLYDIAAREAAVLGDTFAGMYLTGSAAIGDFDLASDVDFLVVTRGDLSRREVGAVQALHEAIYRTNRWTARLEYSFFPLDKLLRWRPGDFWYDDRGSPNTDPEGLLWYFDNGHPRIERSRHGNSLIERWTLRERSPVVGAGPDLHDLLPPVAPDDLRTEIRTMAHGWGAEIDRDPSPYRNRLYQAYLVLAYARMLHDHRAARISSKKTSALWARDHLDPTWRDLIDFAWQERQDERIHVCQPADPSVFPRVLEFVRYAVRQL